MHDNKKKMVSVLQFCINNLLLERAMEKWIISILIWPPLRKKTTIEM
jgi:hypothetical protein